MEGLLGWDITRIWTAAELTANDPNKQIPTFGLEVTDGRTGKKYKFIRATTAWTANDAIVRDYAGTQEPNDGAPCTAVAQILAGIALTTVPVNGAGWVQIQGEYATANVAASTAGQQLGTTATTGRQTGIVFATPTAAEVAAGMASNSGVRCVALDVAAGNLCQVVLNP